MAKTPKMLEIEAREGQPLEDLLEELYVSQCLHPDDIMERLEVRSRTTLNGMLKRVGIPLRSRKTSAILRSKRPGKEELEEKYLELGQVIEALASHYGVKRATASQWLDDAGIKKRGFKSLTRLNFPVQEAAELYYAGLTIEDIGNYYVLNPLTVSRIFKDEGIKIRGKRAEDQPDRYRPPKDELHTLYHKDKKSLKEISEYCNVSVSTICRWIKEEEIPERDHEQAKRVRKGKEIIGKTTLQDWLGQRLSLSEMARRAYTNLETVKKWLKQADLDFSYAQRPQRSTEQLTDIVQAYILYTERTKDPQDLATFMKNYTS